MKIAVQTGGPEERYGIKDAYRVIAEAGFDAVDANVDHLFRWDDIMQKKIPACFLGGEKTCLEAFRPWKEGAEAAGIENYQAHAPFPTYIYSPDDPAYNDALINVLEKTIMGCDYIGCHKLVVHPFFLAYDTQLSREEEWANNIDRYSRLIPAAKKYGVTILLENMFTVYRGKLYTACCSDITTACRYIDTLNEIAGEKLFAFCLDTGHLLITGQDIKETMLQLEHRIEAFHVHDNNGASDQHLAPYMGVMDWNRFIEGLREIGFNQTMSFETFNIWNVMDREIAPEMLRVIAKTGRMFARRAEE